MDWISVKDRLPKHEGYYNCKNYMIFCGYITIAFWYNDKWISDPDEFYTTYEPTHWMPLPEEPVSQ
jgi:hypothetical protein